MNDLVKINNSDLSVKEFNGQRVVTFKDIDRLHERVEGTAGRNFRENKNHFRENEDFFFIKPSDVGNNEIRRSEINNKGTYLITESGYLMLVKSLSDDLAWTVQRELVNKYFRVKNEENTFDMSELSPELQMFNKMLQAVAKSELEQKKIKQQLNEVNHHALEAKEEASKSREEVQAIREVVTLDTNSWRKDTATLINKIATKLGGFGHIQPIREEIYNLLDNTYGVKLQSRLLNKQKKMALEGVPKYKIDKVNKLDVISDDKKLINGYVNIVGKMAIKYGVA
ncbi:ORF6N domain-containing protein [Clostridium perfringens]|nr:ORF6N domain-containing protein [Clostridium perfringens]HAT4339439.1 ORF6N domain-containing protein [Clostridium perfringens]HAT4346315.1 ORF6N domain-containing protein [Clostridium perfringens]